MYDETCGRFHLAREMDHHPWCLFAVHHTIVHSLSSRHPQGPAAGGASVYVFVGSAEGAVSVWDLTVLLREWIAGKAAHCGRVRCELKEAATVSSQTRLTEATSLEETVTTAPRQSTTPAGVLKEPLTIHQSVSASAPCLPSVPLHDGGSEASVSQLARCLESSAVSGVRAGEKAITESTGEGSVVVPLFPGTCTDTNHDPTAEMVENTLDKGGGGGVGGVRKCPSLVFSAHQSGVNAMDVCQVDGKECLYMVLSGGDDMAISVSLCRLRPQDLGMVTSKTHPSAHFSAVTGKDACSLTNH